MDPRLVPDKSRMGAWVVRVGNTDQSFVDPYDPTYLEFEYVQRIVDVIETVFEEGERLAVIHVGGAGMTIPRYIAHTRPTSAQIVLEPDVSLTAAVREAAPLPRQSGIKVRPLDGRSGIAQLADNYADLVVVDAFEAARVPSELGTTEWFAEVRRVVKPTGIMVMNITDHTPFDYAHRLVAGIMAHFSSVVVGSAPATLKGRRFGNLVISAGQAVDPWPLVRKAAGAVYPYRMIFDLELDRWIAGAQPFTDQDACQSPEVPPDLLFLRTNR